MARGFWRQRAPSLTPAHDLKCQRLLNAFNVGFILLKHRDIVFNPTPNSKIPIVRRLQNLILLDLYTRDGIEDIRLEAKAKATKKIQGQGQAQPFRGQTLSRPRTGMLEAKDQGHKRKCSPKKFFQTLHKILTIQKILLSSSRGQANFRGLEASRPRPRTSKCVLEDVLEARTSSRTPPLLFTHNLFTLINCF